MVQRVVVQDWVCDKCPGATPAVVTEKFSHNGQRWSIDLCQQHSERLYADITRWSDAATELGAPSVFDKAIRRDGPVKVPVRPEPVRVARAALPELDDVAAADPVRAAHPGLRSTLGLPPTAANWTFTDHALQRLAERHIDKTDVLMACVRPDWVRPSKTNPALVWHVWNGLQVVVNPDEQVVVTVAHYNTADAELAEDGLEAVTA